MRQAKRMIGGVKIEELDIEDGSWVDAFEFRDRIERMSITAWIV